MFLTDTIALDATSVRETRDGYMVGTARIARTGIQHYTAAEMGLTDRAPTDIISVYRPPEAVFDDAALAGLAHRPMTNDHPTENVTAANWKKLAIGYVGGDVAQDGKFVRVPFALMDAAAINDVKSGKRHFSVGYQCHIDMKDGVTPEGEAYQAVQSQISPNHVALCGNPRGGNALTIDSAPVQKEAPTMTTKTIIVDGLSVETTDAAEKAIVKLQGQVVAANDAKAVADAEVVKVTAEAVAKDAKIAELTAALDAAKITPAALRDAAKAFATTVAKAKAAGFTVTDAMDETAIMRGVVDSKMKDVKDEHLQVAFDALTAGLKIDDGADPLATSYKALDGKVVNLGDAAKAEQDAYERSVAAFARKKSA